MNEKYLAFQIQFLDFSTRKKEKPHFKDFRKTYYATCLEGIFKQDVCLRMKIIEKH